MNKLSIYKPPKLALLEQKTKLRDYLEEERNSKTFNLIGNLLITLGVSEGKIEHHKRLQKFINDCYSGYTYEEIDEAFDMYVSGKFALKPYQQLNAVVFGQVMREYEFYKKERLKEYRRKMKAQKIATKELSEEDKENIMLEAVDRIKKDYQHNRKITEECSHVYDYLFSKGLLMRHDKDFRDTIYLKAIKVAKNEAKELSKGDYATHKELKNILSEITKGNSDDIVPITKRLVLEEYFKNL